MTNHNGYHDKLPDLSRVAELYMIELQSLVSQRQLAVQLTTRLLQMLNEMSKQIIGNLGGRETGDRDDDPDP
jgi:hypothetical protein